MPSSSFSHENKKKVHDDDDDDGGSTNNKKGRNKQNELRRFMKLEREKKDMTKKRGNDSAASLVSLEQPKTDTKPRGILKSNSSSDKKASNANLANLTNDYGSSDEEKDRNDEDEKTKKATIASNTPAPTRPSTTVPKRVASVPAMMRLVKPPPAEKKDGSGGNMLPTRRPLTRKMSSPTISWNNPFEVTKSTLSRRRFSANSAPGDGISWRNVFDYQPRVLPKVTLTTTKDEIIVVGAKKEEEKKKEETSLNDNNADVESDAAWKEFETEMEKVETSAATTEKQSQEVFGKEPKDSSSSEEPPTWSAAAFEQASYEARIAKLRLKAASKQTDKRNQQSFNISYKPELAQDMNDESSKKRPATKPDDNPLKILREKRAKTQRLSSQFD